MPAPTRAPTRHDGIFKELLHRFLPDFMHIFFPDHAKQLNFAGLRFVEQEVMGTFPDTTRRIADVVAEVATVTGKPEYILVHIEVEAGDRHSLPQRMWEYYALLSLARERDVFPVAIVLLPNSGGLGWKLYTREVLEQEVLRFFYGQVGLRDLPSETYLERGEPLAAALSVLMAPEALSPAEVKLSALQQVVGSTLNEAEKRFLWDLIQTYLPREELPNKGGIAMEQLVDFEMTWSERFLAEGEARGEARGLVRGKQEVILQVLEMRFGTLPETVEAQLRAITDEAQLNHLTSQMLSATSLDDLDLGAA